MTNEELNQNESQEGIKIIDTNTKAEVNIDKKEKSIYKEILNYIILIIVAFLAAQLIHRYLFTPVTVDGASMNPNLEHRDVLFLTRSHNYERLDVVVFKAPEGDYFIKRVIGLPGDTLSYVETQLYLNGEKFVEPYADKTLSSSPYVHEYTYNFTLKQICEINNVKCDVVDGEYKIPEGYYFVMGDNRSHSNDSRMIGLIKEEKFIGEAKYIMYPFNRIGKIKSK